jgi:hypothetical protein
MPSRFLNCQVNLSVVFVAALFGIVIVAAAEAAADVADKKTPVFHTWLPDEAQRKFAL